MSVRTDELRRHPFSTQALDDDVSGAISFEELRDGLARLTSPPVRISFDDWEHMTRGFTVKKDGEDGEELLDQEGFHRLMRQVGGALTGTSAGSEICGYCTLLRRRWRRKVFL